MTLAAAHITVTGVVQGVGFRPFVYRLASEHALAGWVRNTNGGVEITVEGAAQALEAFVRDLERRPPPLAQVAGLAVAPCPAAQLAAFHILPSLAGTEGCQPVPADTAVCPDCLRELFDPADRRYRYPFINCTHCGPRLTLITALPYDRPHTTMAGFTLCPACAAEYNDPANRRFHAQPVACPACGPAVWYAAGSAGATAPVGEAALAAARACLQAGGLLAVKGLGGFHLACRADDGAAVARLRARKQRGDKPLALMAPDLAAIEALCAVTPAERALLASPEHPIVVLARRPDAAVAPEIAPGQATLGVMLPYTPLYHLLLERAPGFPTALVMTSGNLSEEPLVIGNAEALERLAGVADAFLLHNRDIHTRCDDSVVRLAPLAAGHAPAPVYLRRARGYAPRPLAWPARLAGPPLLATGAELKNAFCLVRDRQALLSQHIGDLENFETLQAFEAGVALYEDLFQTRPAALAHDLHPDYLATRYALARAEREAIPALGVQHHHAHIAACLADAGHPGDRPVIGLACDGTGYGPDGALWGGEFLLADYGGYQRALHLAYVPLPGGDAAVREPWRMALAWLHHAGLAWEADLPPVRHALEAPNRGPAALAAVQRLTTSPRTPRTSSLGRLFDAAAALAGVRQTVSYEGQAAQELEALAGTTAERGYAFEVGEAEVDAAPAMAALAADVRAGLAVPQIAARFHQGVAHMLLDVCVRLRRQSGLGQVALSGGVWQNVTLLRLTSALLAGAGFEVITHRQVPANDGGLALGQAAVAAAWLNGLGAGR